MSIISRIKNGKGTDDTLRVNEQGAASVIVQPLPPDDAIQLLPFASFFKNESGSNNMIVTSADSFFIESIGDRDVYVKSISIQISDPSSDLSRFGALPALTNGLRFRYSSAESGDIIIDDEIKTNLDMFRSATAGKGFGSGTSAWLADISGGAGEDTYFPEIDFALRFGLPWGIRIPKNSDARLIYDVRDNLNGLAVFNIKAFGFLL